MKATKRKSILFLLTAFFVLAASSVNASFYHKSSELHNTALEKKGLIGENFAGSKSLGEQFDPNTNFYYLRARWMDPNNGRFISVDQFGGYKSIPISLHKYLYGNVSPVNFSDPTGRFTLSSVMATVIIVGDLKMPIVRYSTPDCNKCEGPYSHGGHIGSGEEECDPGHTDAFPQWTYSDRCGNKLEIMCINGEFQVRYTPKGKSFKVVGRCTFYMGRNFGNFYLSSNKMRIAYTEWTNCEYFADGSKYDVGIKNMYDYDEYYSDMCKGTYKKYRFGARISPCGTGF